MKVIVMMLLLGCGSILVAQKPEAIKEYNAGLTYFKLKNYKGAIPFFEAAISKDPNFVHAFRALISCHEETGQNEIAVDLYERVIELSPSDKTLCYNLALTYISLEEYQKSVLYLRKALQIDPAYSKATNKLKEIEEYLDKQAAQENIRADGDAQTIENKAYNAALEVYRTKDYNRCLTKLNDYKGEITNPDFYYLKAIAHQHIGERENAIAAYENTLELDDRHFNTNLNLGRIYYNDRNYLEAIPLLETAYLRRDKDVNLLYDLAKAHFYAQEYQAANVYLEDYTKRNSKNAEAWRLLGESYSKLGKSKNAAKAFEWARKYGTNDDDLHNHLDDNISKYGREASEYTKDGKYEEAIKVLEKGIIEHSEAASLHFNLGLNYMEVGNTKKAREEFKKTIDLEPAHAKAYQGLGQIYYEREEFQEAGAYYLATIDAGKQDEFVYYKLGSCWFKLKRFENAIIAYQKAIGLNSKEKRYYFSLGLSYLALDKHYDAIAAMDNALRIDPLFLDAKYHIAISYLKMSEYDTCIAKAEEILKQDSQYAKAYLVIGHAHKRMGNYGLASDFQKKAERLDPSLRQ